MKISQHSLYYKQTYRTVERDSTLKNLKIQWEKLNT